MRNQSSATFAALFVLALVQASCTAGTLSEDELFADYQVEPEDDPATLIREVFAELEDDLDTRDVALLELTVQRTGDAWLLARHPGEQGRIYGFRYDGFWLSEGDLESTDTDALAPRLFGLDELPLEQLPAMIEAARAEMDFAPASLVNLRFERNERSGQRLELTITFRSFEDSGAVTVDVGPP